MAVQGGTTFTIPILRKVASLNFLYGRGYVRIHAGAGDHTCRFCCCAAILVDDWFGESGGAPISQKWRENKPLMLMSIKSCCGLLVKAAEEDFEDFGDAMILLCQVWRQVWSVPVSRAIQMTISVYILTYLFHILFALIVFGYMYIVLYTYIKRRYTDVFTEFLYLSTGCQRMSSWHPYDIPDTAKLKKTPENANFRLKIIRARLTLSN